MNPSYSPHETSTSKALSGIKVNDPVPQIESKSQTLRKSLLACGILSSFLYVVMNIVSAMFYEEYSSASQTISELSAIDAPTRAFWVPWGFVYTLLVTAFGWGVWQSAANKRSLRITGTMLILFGVIGLGWPFAPMHQREVLAAGGGTMTDTMHIVFSIVTVLLMLLAIGFSASALGKRFCIYSLITIVVLFVFGALTGMAAPKIEANLPTPWIGISERINVGAFMLWAVVLAIVLLRKENDKRPTYILPLN